MKLLVTELVFPDPTVQQEPSHLLKVRIDQLFYYYIDKESMVNDDIYLLTEVAELCIFLDIGNS